MPLPQLIDAITRHSRGQRRDKYLAERNALDLLEINLKEKDNQKKDYLTGQGKNYEMLINQLSDQNITQEEFKNVQSSLSKIENNFKDSDYSDDIVASSYHNFYKSNLNEAMENVEESMQWRGELKEIVTSLDNIPKYDKESGSYNTQHTVDIMDNITRKKAQYADKNRNILETLSKLEEIGVQRGYVTAQLQRYKETPIDEKANPTLAIAVREAAEARKHGDWNLAYGYLTKAAGSELKDAKANSKTAGQLQKEYNDRARESFRRNVRYGESNPHKEGKLGTEYNILHSQFASYPSTVSDWGSIDSSQIDRRFRTIVKRTIKLDNALGDITGGDLLGGNALLQHQSSFKDDMSSYAALMSGMIMPGEGKGNYNYADGKVYMKGGKVLEGAAIGEYDMPMSETVKATMRDNVGNIIYDVSEGGEQAYVQDTMAGDAMAYIETLPQWVDDEWVRPELSPEEAALHLKETAEERQKKIETSNKQYGTAQSRLVKLEAQKAALISKIRKTKKGYQDTETYDDKRIEGIRKSAGGAKKQFDTLNLKIRLEEDTLKHLRKLLGEDISEEYNDTAEARDIVNSIKPLSLV